MAQAPTHSLLSLPDDEIIQKLGGMSFEEILKFSLISERCKELVKSIQIKGDSMRVSIGRNIAVTIETSSKSIQLTYYREPNMYWGIGAYGRKKKLTEPQSVLVEVTHYRSDNEDTTSELEKKGFTMKNLLEHLQDIFNYPKIDYIRFSEDSSEFDIDDIKEVFGNTLEVKIQDTGCRVFNQLILERLNHFKELRIKNSSFPNSEFPEKILMKNFTGLHIGNAMEEFTMLSLDQLSIINSKGICIEGLQMSAKQFNKFIKLWQKGSTPRLEWLAIHYTGAREDDDSVIMRGIEHSVVPTDTIRKFKRPGNVEPYLIEGGMDIHRMDGLKATIQFTSLHVPFSAWHMYVWFDHCFVES
ncbi:unnamed protein product [Caenorhabditis brenneri]